MKRTHVVSLGLTLVCGVALAQAQPAAVKLPADATLVKPLGFRTAPGLGDSFVVSTRNYLPAATRVRLLSANGPMWAPNTYCQAEYAGKTGWIRCDDASALSVQAAGPQNQPVPNGGPATAAGQCSNWSRQDAVKGLKFCTDVDSCRAFCQCDCTFNPSGWTSDDKTDTTTTCRAMPAGPGLIPSSSSELKPVPSFSTIRVGSGARATQSVIDGLTRLDAAAAAAPWKSKYKVFVKSCYRQNDDDLQEDCSYVLKAAHILKKYATTPPANAAERKSLAWAQRAQDPRNLGRALPGANPHSAGVACDIQMLDERGKALFDWQVSASQDTPAVREASRALDEAVTKSGGKRLTYETWHYEWGGMASSRCTFPACDA
jgi:D-alanyl-D-alanine dipeptidase